MGGDGVSDISAGAGEGVGGMVNGAGLTSGSISRSGASGGGSTMGAKTCVDNELAKVSPAADKGNMSVVLDKDDYLAEADSQLSDRSTYQPLISNPTQSYNQDLHHLISTAGSPQGLFKMDISLPLKPQPRTPSLYLLPKTHKPGNPGCPFSPPMVPPLNASLPTSTPTSNHLLNPSPPMSRILTTFFI